jgi:hypothetical protein
VSESLSDRKEAKVSVIMQTPEYLPEIPMSSFQLMVGAGALLIAAALLLGLRRTRNVTVQRSLLTDELMIYLGRIADALERNAPEMAMTGIERRIEEREHPKLDGKVHEMPFSMLGREYPEKK